METQKSFRASLRHSRPWLFAAHQLQTKHGVREVQMRVWLRAFAVVAAAATAAAVPAARAETGHKSRQGPTVPPSWCHVHVGHDVDLRAANCADLWRFPCRCERLLRGTAGGHRRATIGGLRSRAPGRGEVLRKQSIVLRALSLQIRRSDGKGCMLLGQCNSSTVGKRGVCAALHSRRFSNESRDLVRMPSADPTTASWRAEICFADLH